MTRASSRLGIRKRAVPFRKNSPDLSLHCSALQPVQETICFHATIFIQLRVQASRAQRLNTRYVVLPAARAASTF